MATRLEIPEDTEVEEDGQSFAMNPLVLQDSRTMQFSFYGPNLLKSFRVLSLILWYYDTSTISLHQIQLQVRFVKCRAGYSAPKHANKSRMLREAELILNIRQSV